MFDVFVAPLRCPGCGALVPEAEIQTGIRDGSADSSALTVGYRLDPVDLEPDAILSAGYLLISPPEPDGPIKLLDVWICPRCQTEEWAVVEIGDHTIRRIEAVRLDRAVLKSANYISEVNADLLADALRGAEPAGDDAVEILRQLLPRG